MRKFKRIPETIDALEEEIAKERKFAKMAEAEYRPTSFIVALYALVQLQFDWLLEAGGTAEHFGSWEEAERQEKRYEAHEQLGIWIEGQPNG